MFKATEVERKNKRNKSTNRYANLSSNRTLHNYFLLSLQQLPWNSTSKKHWNVIFEHYFTVLVHAFAPLPFLLGEGGNFQSQILQKRGSEKNECLGGLKRVSVTDICLEGLLCFLSKKTFKNMALRDQFQMSILACFSQTTN